MGAMLVTSLKFFTLLAVFDLFGNLLSTRLGILNGARSKV